MLHFLRILLVFTGLLPLVIYGQSSNPVGDAYEDGDDCYVVTNDVLWQLGAVWFNDPLDLSDPFEIQLQLYFGNDDGGADGLVMVFQQIGTSALGLPGGGLGFEGFSPSLGIELDTFQNEDLGDPWVDHMAILSNGNVNHNGSSNLAGPVGMSAANLNFEDNQFHDFKLTWDPTLTELKVFIDCQLRITYTGDIIGNIFNGNSEVFWGFTGSTGGLSNEQSVCISQYALGLEENYEMCQGESVQLGVTGGIDGIYSWSPDDDLVNPTSAFPVASPSQTTEYTVTYTDVCGDQTTLETVLEVIEVDVELEPLVEMCEGETYLLDPSGEAESWSWSTGDQTSFLDVDSEGMYTVTGTVGACWDEATAEVVVYENPDQPDLDPLYEACEGESVTLDATVSGTNSYSWSSGEEDSQIEVADSQELDVIVTSEFGCVSTAFTEVNFIAYPVNTLPETVEACDGETITLTAGEAENWVWGSGEDVQSIEVETSGIYSVLMSIGDCVTSGETTVDFNPVPEFDWPDAVSFCEGSTVWIELPALAYDWTWEGFAAADSVEVVSEGDWTVVAIDTTTFCTSAAITEAEVNTLPSILLPEQGVICDDTALVIEGESLGSDTTYWGTGEEGNSITVVIPDIYTFIAENECGTNQQDIEVVAGLCNCPLYVPNSFTPDLDGMNEIFVPSVSCDVEFYRFAVYNRWGEVIFETNEIGKGWNGSGKGESHWVPNDVYVWQVTYRVDLFDGIRLVDETGTLTVFR